MSLQGKQLVIFDFDGTLSRSKQPMTESMAHLMTNLIKHIKVAVISGGGYHQFQKQFITSLPHDAESLTNLYLLPTSGTKFYVWQGEWVQKYSEDFTPSDKKRIMDTFRTSIFKANFEKPPRTYGETVEDRDSQITYSGLGQEAPIDLKEKWDPTREKRQKIIALMAPKLPEFDIRIGGTTSIDVTRRGINKAYGIHKLEQFLDIPISAMIFVGDALYFGGNDYPAKATGIDCIEVKDPDETERLIRSWFE